MMKTFFTIVVMAACVGLAGCGEMAMRQKERQMELVARDWAMTIRASQVIPVYPLSQDIQPGDVFVVNQTVAEQSGTFRDRGFMPTDLRICRLSPIDYASAYSARVAGTPPALILPGAWRGTTASNTPWSQFPRAGFPTYTFKVSNSGGLSAALPVQSIPVALSLTGAASGTGWVTISDAVTYGIDATTMYDMLDKARHEGRLNGLKPIAGEPLYLRVVTRVFAAKTFDISMSMSSTMGGGADVGAPKPVRDPGGSLESGLSVTDINAMLDSNVNVKGVNGAMLPGGSVRATFASHRTIGFKETFDEPIVVGYQGFDLAMDEQGNFGPIIPSFQVLQGKGVPRAPTAVNKVDSAYMAMIALLRQMAPDKAAPILAHAAKNSPALKMEYEKQLAGDKDRPVAAWIQATTGLKRTNLGRETLLQWLAAAIREGE